MYNSLQLANSIKTSAKSKSVVIGDMLKSCDLGVNTLSNLNHGKSIAFDSLARIADYLGVSVDYLLGRTDNPEINKQAVSEDSTQSLPESVPADETAVQVAVAFQKLDFASKLKVMQLIQELTEKKNPANS